MSHYYIIINPASGHKKAKNIFNSLMPRFDLNQCTYDVSFTTKKGDAFSFAYRSDISKYDGIIIIGGDGTAHEVINGMLNRSDAPHIPIGIIPAGTGNSLMHHLSCHSPDTAIQSIIRGHTIDMDLYEMADNNRIIYFFNVIAWGVPASVNILAEKLRIFRGWRYNIAAIIEIFRNRKNKVVIQIGEEKLEGDYSFVVGCNTIYTGNAMKMAPEANLTDGLLDLLIVKRIDRLQLLMLFKRVFSGTHLPHTKIQYLQVPSFSISTDDSQSIIVDGEIVGNTPFNVRLSTKRIKVFI